MSWYVAAIISAFALSGQALAFQHLQKHYSIRVYLTYVWLGAAFVLGLFYFRPSDLPLVWINIVPLTLAALSSLGGIYTYNKAIEAQSNIGYIEAVASIRIVFTYVASILFFQANLEWIRLLGIACTSYGVYLVAGRLEFERHHLQAAWTFWALAAGVFFALLTIFVRLATDGGVSAQLATVYVLFLAGLVFLLSCAVDKTSLRPKAAQFWPVIVAIAFATVGNAAEFVAFETAPNLAYAVTIDNTRMIILYIVGLVAFAETPQRVKGVGIVLGFLGVVLLS